MSRRVAFEFLIEVRINALMQSSPKLQMIEAHLDNPVKRVHEVPALGISAIVWGQEANFVCKDLCAKLAPDNFRILKPAMCEANLKHEGLPFMSCEPLF